MRNNCTALPPKICFLVAYCGLLVVFGQFATSSTAQGPKAEQPVPSAPRAIASLTLHNLSQIDAKLAQLGKRLDGLLSTPLSLVSAIARWENGVDVQGDFALLLVANPVDSGPSTLCVQIPVTDYEQFVESLGGNSVDTVTVVQVAGQQLLATHVGQSAILAEQKEAELLEEIVGSELHELLPTLSGEKSSDFNASVLLSQEAIRRFLHHLNKGRLDDLQLGEEDPFGDGEQPEKSSDESEPWIAWLAVRLQASEWNAELEAILEMSQSIATGLRMTDAADLLLDCQLEWLPQESTAAELDVPVVQQPLQNRIAAGPFISFGGGRLPPGLSRAFVLNHSRRALQEIRGDYDSGDEGDQNGKQDRNGTAKFVEQIGKLWESVQSLAAIHRPAPADEGVYSNNFLLLSTDDAALTHSQIVSAFDSWNWLMDDAEDEMALQFNSAKKKIGDRETTEFTADMVVAVGGPPLPEVRNALEALFGPGAMMRIQITTVDDHTVLLANASTSQIEKLLAEIESADGKLIESPELAAAKKLLRPQPAFEFYLQPHAMSVWADAAQTAGMENIVGGPLVEEFPESPPLGIGINGTAPVTNVQLAVQVDTFAALWKYLLKKK